MTRRSWLIPTLAVVSVAAVLGVLSALSQAPPPRSQAPPSDGSDVIRAADPVPWAGVTWHTLSDPFLVGDPKPTRIDGLAGRNAVLVGWGRVAAPGRNQFNDMGAVFVSLDGQRWRSVALDDGVAPQDASEVGGVAVGPLGMLAFGGVCCTTQEQAVWRSVDALRWARVPIDGDIDPRVSAITRVAGSATGWVAVGSHRNRAAIWTSSDGLVWHAVDPAAARLGIGVVSDVAATGDGLVAVGTIDDPAGTHDGAVWVSADGTNWARVADADPGLTGPDETELSRVISFAGGLFIVGNHGSHEERVRCERLLGGVASLDVAPPPQTALSCGWGREHHWLSPDGSSWVRLPPLDPLPGQPQPPGRRPIEFRILAAGGPGLVNLAEDTVPPEGDTRIWVSADGRAWLPVDPPFPVAGSTQAGIRVVGRHIVAIGENAAVAQGVGISIGTVP